MTGTRTREHLVLVTSAGHARDHAVIAETLAERSRAHAEVVAQCGEKFWPAPLVADPGELCPRCVRYVRACREGRRAEDQHREGVIGRWLSAVVGTARRCTGEADSASPDGGTAHGSTSREVCP